MRGKKRNEFEEDAQKAKKREKKKSSWKLEKFKI